MDFALFGADDESIFLAKTAISEGHRIVWWGDLAREQGQFDESWIAIEDQQDRWELLLDQQACDAVIAGRGAVSATQRAEQVNLLVKNGIAVLTTFPLVESVLSYYEIDMSRTESGAVLWHFNPLIEEVSLRKQCEAWIRDGHPQLGRIEQIVWERPLRDRSREQVLWHFARDVEWLARVAGRLDRLGAHGSPDEHVTYSGLSVQMLGERKLPVRWSVGPGEQSFSPRMELFAEQGKLTIEFDLDAKQIHFETIQAVQSQSTSAPMSDSGSSAMSRFVAAVENQDSTESTWPDALRAMELTDTIEISLRRGRMIDVHPQQLTEQLAFKGTMSAVGCGALMVLPPILLLGGWLGAILGVPLAHYWPHLLLVFLAVFLGIQFVPFLLSRKSSLGNRSSNDSERQS